MEASIAPSSSLPTPRFEPDAEAIKRRLLKKGVYPTPKIVRTLRKKQIQKHNRKLNKISQTQEPQPLTPSQQQVLVEESHFQTLKREYKDFTKAIGAKSRTENSGLLVGRPWERIERVRLREIASGSKEFNGEKLKREDLTELKEIFEDDLRWVLDNDIEIEDGDWLRSENETNWEPEKRRRSEGEAIQFLVDRLSVRDVTVRDWKLAKMMKQSGLRFSEGQLLKIVGMLGGLRKWEQALAVVEWVYNDKDRRDCKSRFVYTKLLSVLGKGRRPQEALRLFNLMREDFNTYPDMASYHSIAVTLGQTGLLKELMKIIDCMRQKPSKKISNLHHKKWDPVLEPDLVIYNAVLNACVPSQQWKGVWWVFEQLRNSGLKPNGATYGLAMEVMLHSGKYDMVHEFFGKMNRSGQSLKALTYKVLVRAFWEEGKVSEAVEAVREMEERGVVGAASVYYELACCLCNNGRWRDALLEVENIKKLRHCKPLEYTFTGMIQSSIDGGFLDDCISIFEYMKAHCNPNIGTINTMLKVYSRNDMFSEAKQLFEKIKGANGRSAFIIPDKYTYSAMLEISASALQWEYFEHVYKEMAFAGYQLDQSRHASVLVEASRAGKDHLLEHAFETILEAEEIPHPLLFIEMVYQATAQHNYERAVALLNTMAYAPFQVTDKQWRDLFEKNRDKISCDNLEKLLKALGNTHISSEITVSNLSRTLHNLCGHDTFKILSGSSAPGIVDIAISGLETDGEITGGDRELVPSCGWPDEYPRPEDLLVNKADANYDISTADHFTASGEDQDEMNLATSMKGYADELAAACSNRLLSNVMLDEYLPSESTSEDDDSRASKLPSATQILDAWKDSRKGDGIFLSFGQKKV